MSSIPIGRRRMDAQRAIATPAFLVAGRRVISGIVICVRGARCYQTKYLLGMASRPRSRSGPGRGQLLGHSRPRSCSDSSTTGRAEKDLVGKLYRFCDCLRPSRAPHFPARDASLCMVLTQGALGYGLTPFMGAVVVEIFQGKALRSHFRNHQWSPHSPGGSAGPMVTGRAERRSGVIHLPFAVSA